MDGTPRKPRQWQYKPYAEEERPKRLAQIKEEAPEMLRRLRELPQADGTLDQAQEQMADFYSVWKIFRIKAMRCEQKGWLTQVFYQTEAWRNYEALKRQLTRFKTWKTRDNQRRYQEMTEEQRERRRKRQRESGHDHWFNKDRALALAKRCIRHHADATTVKYLPVLRLIRKHATQERPERYMIDHVTIAIAAHRYNPHDPQSVRAFEGTLKMCCAPGLDQESRDRSEQLKKLWRTWAKEVWEDSDGPRFQVIIDET